jgi:F0F1-type ATP synthase membrane subunit b/b'
MAERQASLDDARARADERLGGVLDTMAKEADTARQDLRRRAEDLARLLAGRLLGREIAS